MIAFLRNIVRTILFGALIWLSGLVWFASQMPQSTVDAATTSDAIVVLTGGSDRLQYGLQLLTRGKAKQLFISGVSKDVTLGDIIRQAAPADQSVLQSMDADTIVLGREATNTIGNARETVDWLHAQHYRSILLVTANYHMPRSIAEFSEVAPDIQIIPAPVFPKHFDDIDWWAKEDIRPLLFSEYHKFIAARLRHWLIYVMKDV